MSLTNFETTQGTFYGRYMHSCKEICSIIEDDSKKRRQLMNSINSSSNDKMLTFNQLITKFKVTNIMKKDKVEVFMNLLHLKRENKITLEQNNIPEFSDIYIATKI